MERVPPIDAAKRYWWIIVLFTVGGALVGAVPQPDSGADAVTRWTAGHTILVSPSSTSGSIFQDPLAFNQLELFATTGQVPLRAAERIGFDGAPAGLAAQVSVTAEEQRRALRLSTTQADPDRAVEIADGFADELIVYLAERQDRLREDRLAASLERLQELETQLREAETRAEADETDAVAAAELDALRRQYSVVFEQFNVLGADQDQLVLTSLERAEAFAVTEVGLAAPRSRVGRGAFAGLAGMALGFGVALLLARTDRRIRRREQAESVLGLPTSVVVPSSTKSEAGPLAVLPERHDPLSDSYRTLRTVVAFAQTGRHRDEANITLVVSPGAGDGKTTVAANLTAAFVESGSRTLAVNTDFRRPAISRRLLGYAPPPAAFSLTDVPIATLDMLTVPTDVPGLSVLDLAGVPDAGPGDLARTTARLIPRIVSEVDDIVIDTSPVGATAEVLEFVPMAHTVLIVIRLGHTSADAARRTVEMVNALRSGDVLLVVLGGDPSESSYYYRMEPPSKPRRFGRHRSPDPSPERVPTP